MKLEGLVRVVKKLQGCGLEIGTLITDCHTQITKWIREELPNTIHYYDVWHVAKSKYMCTLYILDICTMWLLQV